MPTKPRSEIFQPGEQAIVHVMNRCVQQSFLLGNHKTGRFGHRRKMFEKELRRATSGFGIDVLSYAIMENHFHLILRSRPDVVTQWDDRKVVRQWHKLCPLFKHKNGSPIENPSNALVDKVVRNKARVARWRVRLSDISWFMKLISQKIAKMCNAEVGKNGHFWQGRYKAVLLLDERALLACSMYVDLNRIQAELAKTLETSDYTSIQRRLQAIVQNSMRSVLAAQVNANTRASSTANSVAVGPDVAAEEVPAVGTSDDARPDAHLSPVHIDEKNDPIGPHLSNDGSRCSDKGFLPITQKQYIELLRWTADQLRHTRDGQKFDNGPATLVELELAPDVWCKLVTQFTDMFFVVAGMPEAVDNHRSRVSRKRFYMPQQTRELLTA